MSTNNGEPNAEAYEERTEELDDDYDDEDEDEYEDEYDDEYEANNTVSNENSTPNKPDSYALTTTNANPDNNGRFQEMLNSSEPILSINKRKRRRATNNRSYYNDNEDSHTSGFEMYEKSEVIQVNCNSIIGELHKKKFGSGGKGACIRVVVDVNSNGEMKTEAEAGVEKWMTPIEFEAYCGKSHCRDWKKTLKAGGESLATLMENNVLVCHAVSCSCAACKRNESLVGPFRPFTRYRRRKKDEILAQNAFKKFLSLKPPTLLQDSLQKIQSGIAKSCGGGYSNNSTNSGSVFNEQSADPGRASAVREETPLNNKQVIRIGLENQKEFAACLEEFEESEEGKWLLLEQECNRMVSQVQSLQQAIQRTRRESEFNRNILIKKFFNNS